MAENEKTQRPTEHLPALEGGVSAIASAHAPFLYFDRAPIFGFLHGIINVNLEATRGIPVENQPTMLDRVTVAHLRMSVPAAQELLNALQQALLLAIPSPSGARN